ncbi:MAG: hypothetical protein MH321_00165 [Leptospiraceae bacterium]|nr:hypothetical protein [Leptospiraceae bacterium]
MLNPKISFLEFIESLPNMEKTRNFYSLKAYSLKPFEELLSIFKFNYRPKLRFSIVGTNGKGSLAHYLSTVLQSKYSVGLYTSPHLIHPFERIRINGQNVQASILDEILNGMNIETLTKLKDYSYFEIFTLFCMLSFQEKKLDYEIYEAGLGGRLDATKLVHSEVIILTKIDLDHMQILGSTKEKILLEKLGICNSSTKRIYALDPFNDKLKNIIQEFAKQNSVELEIFKQDDSSSNYLDISYQFANFILRKEGILLDTLNLNKDWKDLPRPPGRLELIKNTPLIIYDTGHNPGACENLLKDLNKLYPKVAWDCMLSILPDKDVPGIYKIFQNAKNVDTVYASHFPPFSLDLIPNGISIANEDFWVRTLKSNIKKERPTLVCGSFRVYKLLKEMFANE